MCLDRLGGFPASSGAKAREGCPGKPLEQWKTGLQLCRRIFAEI